MINRTLIAILFALGMLFGGTFAAQQPAEPAEPAEPAPTQPADPVDPDEPAEPVDPVEPVDPIDEPVDPVEPDPEAPADPADPVEPIEPVEPADPVDPVSPADDVTTADFFSALTANPELTAFAQAFDTARIQDQLDPMAEWTVFAPADSVVFDQTAFEGPDALSTYIVEGAYSYEDLRAMAEEQGGSATLTTLHGQEITVELIGDMLLVAGVAQITEQDIEAGNGFVHVIDAVFQPTTAPAPAGG
jgi:uncharacterized surface protein with fasciclin (FAS1) repeats